MTDDTSSRDLTSLIERFNSAETSNDIEGVLKMASEIASQLIGKELIEANLITSLSLGHLGRYEESIPLLRGILTRLDHPDDTDPSIERAARFELTTALEATGRRTEAIETLEDAVGLWRDIGDDAAVAQALLQLGVLWQTDGDLSRSLQYLRKAQAIYEELGASNAHQNTLHAIGHGYYLAGDLESAVLVQEEAFRMAIRLGDEVGQKQLARNLAEYTFSLEDYQRSLRYIDILLSAARADEDSDLRSHYLLRLGVCLGETGRSQLAVECYQEARDSLAESDQPETALSAFVELGAAQALVDLKRYDQASIAVEECQAILVRIDDDISLLSDLRRRLDDEKGAPFKVDCLHRPIRLILAQSSRGTTHSNPAPAFEEVDRQFVTSELREEERAAFDELAAKLDHEHMTTQYDDSADKAVPNSMMMPTKLHYVDNVAEFEVKWTAYRKAIENERLRLELQIAWENQRTKLQFAEGEFAGDTSIYLLNHLFILSDIAQLYAETGSPRAVLEVCLYAADFIELWTDDIFAATMIWTVRLRLLCAANTVAPSASSELLKAEMHRCLNQIEVLFAQLSDEARLAALESLLLETWYQAARDALGSDCYSRLADLTKGVSDPDHELAEINSMRLAIAVGMTEPKSGTQIFDELISDISVKHQGVKIVLPPDIQMARAIMRFRAVCDDSDSCATHFGPFALHIYQEVCSYDELIFEDPPPGESVELERRSIGGFSDGNLVVLEQGTSWPWVETIMHELEHQMFRAGQQLRTDDGRWLQVKRDVPLASAMTYSRSFAEDRTEESSLTDPGLARLIEIGFEHGLKHPDEAARHVQNMLRYFDDWGSQETSSSYPTGALLVGIARALLGVENRAKVDSYLSHLAVVDHDEALDFAEREATLQL